MKTFRYLIVAVLFLLVAGTSGAQTREEKKEALKTYVGEQVNGRTFKLEASMAYPMAYQFTFTDRFKKHFTADYTLRIADEERLRRCLSALLRQSLSDTLWRRRGVALQGSRRKLL